MFSPSFRENILKTAKALVEDTKMLVSGAASGQDRLSQAAQSSAKTITQLTDVVKLGAASIGSDDPETQVGLPPTPHHPLFFPILSVANHTSVILTFRGLINSSGSPFDNSVSFLFFSSRWF